jgi:hypothetical protein
MPACQGTILEITAKNVGGWAGAKVIFGFAQGMTTATAPIVSVIR